MVRLDSPVSGPPPPVSDPFAGTPYRAVRPLGGGGMGDVFLVEHVALGKVFAAKVLRADHTRSEQLLDRLRLEAHALGRLRHAHIVSVTDFGTTADGRPFLVMESLRGKTLGDELRTRGRLPITEAVRHARALVDALAAAHAIGVVHRDIKLENLFLAETTATELVLKILDFGIARVLPGAPESAPKPLAVPTDAGMVLGTPRFTSPEGAAGDRVDERADLYAAGLVLYTMLAGRGPFDHVSGARELLAAHRSETPRPPSAYAGAPVPAELDALVLAALTKDRRARIQTALGFGRELERIAEHLAEPVGWLQTTTFDPNALATVPPLVETEAPAAGAKKYRARRLGGFTLVLVFLLAASAFSLAVAAALRLIGRPE
jgi:serine/threonine protein kinase